MISKRNIATSIILSIVTCGIYGIYWFISITDDVKTLSNNDSPSGGKAFLFTILTCGIYGIYWSYIMGKSLLDIKTKRNLVAEDNSVLYLILQIFGLGIVNYCLMQNELNIISDNNV